MSYVLVFGFAMVGFVELNTYDDLKRCEAARQAAEQAITELEYYDENISGYYLCIPKPA